MRASLFSVLLPPPLQGGGAGERVSRRPSSRGTILVAYTVLLPVAMLLFAALLSRVETLYMETARMQSRAQTRLLAESALAVLRDARNSRVSGAIEGIGRYAIEPGASGGLRAIGIAQDRLATATCVINCVTLAGAVQPAGFKYGMIPPPPPEMPKAKPRPASERRALPKGYRKPSGTAGMGNMSPEMQRMMMQMMGGKPVPPAPSPAIPPPRATPDPSGMGVVKGMMSPPPKVIPSR